MEDTLQKKIELLLSQYPVFQYGFLESKEIAFKEEVRQICRQECERYDTCWSCPPAVGAVKECQKRCLEYENVLLFTTLAEVMDAADFEESLATRKEHEKIVRQIRKEMQQEGMKVLALSSDSCALCDSCTWPKGQCRYPDKMLPCIESYGILVTQAAEKLAMDFFYDGRTIIWFAMFFFDR